MSGKEGVEFAQVIVGLVLALYIPVGIFVVLATKESRKEKK